MKKRNLTLLLPVLLCSCAGSGNPNAVAKSKNVLVCYAEDRSDYFLGSSVYDAIKKVNADSKNGVKLEILELGTNGANYTNLLEDKISKNSYDYVSLVGEKANFYLDKFIKTHQGVSFLNIDSNNSNSYYNAYKYEFSPEEIGFVSSVLADSENKVGYLSSYKSDYNNRLLYGFLQGQKHLNKQNNVIVKYLEESYNYEKTLDYSQTIFDKYNCDTTFENISDNLPALITKAQELSKSIVSVGSDYTEALLEEEKGTVSNIIIKNYNFALDKMCKDIMNDSVVLGTTLELSIKDNAMSLLNENNIIDDIKNESVVVSKFSDYDTFYNLYDETVVDVEESYTPKYSVAVPYHEAIPNCGEQNDWKYAPRYGADNGMKPVNWTAICAWATIYAQEGFARAKNTGIEFKNMRIWGYQSDVGWKLIEWANPVGSFYDENFTNDYHQNFVNNVFNNSNTKTTRVKLDNSNEGFNYHPFSSQNDLESLGLSKLTYIISTMDIRLVVWDTNKKSDIENAKYVANIGGDWWSKKGATWQPDWSTNRDICVAQYRTITKNWKTLYMSNIPVNQYEEIVGNGEFLNEFE